MRRDYCSHSWEDRWSAMLRFAAVGGAHLPQILQTLPTPAPTAGEVIAVIERAILQLAPDDGRHYFTLTFDGVTAYITYMSRTETSRCRMPVCGYGPIQLEYRAHEVPVANSNIPSRWLPGVGEWKKISKEHPRFFGGISARGNGIMHHTPISVSSFRMYYV